MVRFNDILEQAYTRKGGEEAFRRLLPSPKSSTELMNQGEDRYLAMMTKCINQAGFSWKVIENKWPEFEEAFFKFRIDTLIMLSNEQWEAYMQDRRVVRNWQKIKTVRENALFIYDQRANYAEGFPELLANWPETDQVGLQAYLKRQGTRLGGATAQWFLRNVGKDSFVLSRDVVGALTRAGLDIKPHPSSKRELTLIQTAFNTWQQESGWSMTHISKALAYSFGDNIDTGLSY